MILLGGVCVEKQRMSIEVYGLNCQTRGDLMLCAGPFKRYEPENGDMT